MPTAETLFLIVLSILAMESAGSIRSLYRHFLVRVTSKSLNAFYYACSYAKVDFSGFVNATARLVQAYVTAADKENGARRLFFSTIFPTQLQIFCAWQEKAPLNRAGSDWMQYIPLFLYSFRWNIEVSYYEQKTFWSLCAYMVRSRKGIEMLVSLINISYCAMKLLSYKEEAFSGYRDASVQEFRFALSEQICRQIFYANLVQNIETHIKSNAIADALKHLCLKQSSYL